MPLNNVHAETIPVPAPPPGDGVMPLRDVLVHMDNTRQCRSRLQTAVALAAANGAHLVGLYIKFHYPVPREMLAYFPEETLNVVLKRHAEAANQDEGTLEKQFREVTERAGVSAEWQCANGDPVQSIKTVARQCDLVVISQMKPDSNSFTEDSDLIDNLVLISGRPVLLVPSAGAYPIVGKNVLIAWDGGRRSTRSVNDALPLLKGAERVKVLAINPKGHLAIETNAICRHLDRHGIGAVGEELEAKTVDIGHAIRTKAADMDADLIVMGAYGHTRWRELVLGGVTRHMLSNMTIPVLMSH